METVHWARPFTAPRVFLPPRLGFGLGFESNFGEVEEGEGMSVALDEDDDTTGIVE